MNAATKASQTDTEATAPPPVSKQLKDELRKALGWRLIIAIVLFIGLALIFQSQSDGIYLTSRNVSLMLRQASVVAIAAAGVAILMIMAEIDLSTGSAIYLVGVAAATTQVVFGANLFVTLAVALAVGLLLGAWNGFWVAAVGVPSFIVTLGGLLIFRGVGLMITNASTVSPLRPEYVALSESFVGPAPTLIIGGVAILAIIAILYRGAREAARQSGYMNWPRVIVRSLASALVVGAFVLAVSGYLGTPMSVVWVIVATFVLAFIMSRTVFGRNAYMIGANREAARQSGVYVKRNIFYGFLLMGVVYAAGGVLFTARLNASTPSDGTNLELDAIAAAVIGGVALMGGVGRIPAVIAGALLLAMIDNGMSVTGVSSFAQDVVKGAILLVAVAVDTMLRQGNFKFPKLFSGKSNAKAVKA